MMPIKEVLQRAPDMTIGELEVQIWERDAEIRRLQTEKAVIKPHWDRAWQKRIAATSGPSSLNQAVEFKL